MNSTASAIAQLAPQSRAILTRNAVPNLFLIVLGVPGIIENMIVVAVLLRSRLFAKINHYFCMLNLAISDLLVSTVLLCIGLKRSIIYFSGSNEVSTPSRCEIEFYIYNNFFYSSQLQTLAMGLDRLIGVFAPITYKTMRIVNLRLVNLFFWLLALTIPSIELIGLTPSSLVSACLFGLEYVDWTQSYDSYMTVVIDIIVVAIYVALAVVLKVRQQKAAAGGGLSQNSLRAAKTSLLVAVVFVATFTIPQWTIALLGTVPGGEAVLPYYGPWTLVTTLLPTVINLPMYAWKNEKFRDHLVGTGKAAAIKLCGFKETAKVTPQNVIVKRSSNVNHSALGGNHDPR